MIKKYYSKYTGKQIDEAVAALIENNIKIEDLNEEVVELINSKANEGDLAALQKEIEDNQIKVVEIPIGILQKAANEEALTAEELAFFTSDYKIYKCAVPLEGAEELGLQMYFVTSAITDNTIALSSHLYNVIIDLTTGKVELEASVDLEMVDIKEKVSNLESRTDSLETEVSNVSSAASNAESLAYENQTAIEELHNEINELEELIGDSSNCVVSYEKGTTVPNQGYLEKVYLNDSLTPEEVDSILNNADIEFYSTPGGYDIYELLRTNEVNNWPETIISIYKYNFSEENYGYIITTNKYTRHYPLYISPTLTDLSDVIISGNYEKRGWMFDSSSGEDNISNPCYIIGYPHNELQTTGIWSNVGLNNDVIASIVSTTPFTKQAINEIDEELVQVHTKVDELTNSLNGLLDSPVTAVPASGTLENIYIKIPTSDTWYITDEKFIAVCEQLNFRLGSSCVYTVVQTAKTNIWIGGYWNSTLQKVESFYVSASSTAGERIDFEDGSYGFVGINEEITSAGTQNDLLKDYFSITPFEKSLPEKVGELEEKVEELENKSTVIKLDSVGVDLFTAYNGQSVDRNLTTEEVEAFKQFVNNENLTSLYTKVEGLADVILTKSAYITQDSVDIISFSAIIMDCYLDTIVCIYPEGSGVLGSIEISKRTLKIPKAHECPYFGDEIAQIINGGTVHDRKLTAAELEYFTGLQDSEEDLRIKPSNFNMYMYFQKANYTKNFRLMYNTRYAEQVISIVIMFTTGMDSEDNTVGIMISDLVTTDDFDSLERDVDTLESTIGDIDAVLSEINGSGTTSGDSSSDGSSETYLQLDSIIFDLLTIYTTHENSTRNLTSEEIAFFTDFRNRLINGEKLAGIFSAIDYDGYNIIEMPCQGLLGGVRLNFGIYLAGNYDMNTFTMIVDLSSNVVDFLTMTLSPYSEQPGYWQNTNTDSDGYHTLEISLEPNYLYTFLLKAHSNSFKYQLQLNLITPLNDRYTVTSNTCTFYDSSAHLYIMVYLTYSLDTPNKIQIRFIDMQNLADLTSTYEPYFSGPIYKNLNLKYLNA